jgi:hypothetical protein
MVSFLSLPAKAGVNRTPFESRVGGHEQLISNGGRAFAERDKKQTMIDLREISTNWFKNQLCPSIRLSRLYEHCL